MIVTSWSLLYVPVLGLKNSVETWEYLIVKVAETTELAVKLEEIAMAFTVTVLPSPATEIGVLYAVEEAVGVLPSVV